MTNNDDSTNNPGSGLRTNRRGKKAAKTILEEDQTNESFHPEYNSTSEPQRPPQGDWEQHNYSESYDYDQHENTGRHEQEWEDDHYASPYEQNQHENMGNHNQEWEEAQHSQAYTNPTEHNDNWAYNNMGENMPPPHGNVGSGRVPPPSGEASGKGYDSEAHAQDSGPKMPESYDGNIFYRSSKRTKWQGSWFSGFLVSLFSLNVFGNENLTTRAIISMQRAAVLLSIIFIFDMSLWSVLITMILNQGEFISGFGDLLQVKNIFALALAFCLSVASVIFEASIFTSDLSRLTPGTIFSLLGRIGLVLIAALITAEPLHVMIFKDPITKQAVREQALMQGMQVATEIKKKPKLNKLPPSIIDLVDATSGAKKELKEEVRQLKVDLKAKESRLTEANDKIRWAEGPRCERWFTKKKEKDPQKICKKLTRTRKNEYDRKGLRKKIKELKSEITIVEEEMKKIQPQSICSNFKDKLALYEEQFKDNLDGYARDLLEVTDDTPFTLGSCLPTGSDKKYNSCAQMNADIRSKFDTERTEKMNEVTRLQSKIKKEKNRGADQETINKLELEKACEELVIDRIINFSRNRCMSWCFQYKEPGFFGQLSNMIDVINDIDPRWPEASFKTSECKTMIEDLKFKRPPTGDCQDYKPEEDLDVEQEDSQVNQMVKNVVIVNKDDEKNTLFPLVENQTLTLQCKVKFLTSDPDKKQLYSVSWVKNGQPRARTIEYDMANAAKEIPELTVTAATFNPKDTIRCTVYPSLDDELGKPKSSDPIELSGDENLKEDEEEQGRFFFGLLKSSGDDRADRMKLIYYLVTMIGIFIPLISLLFKLVAPKELSNYYSLLGQAQEKNPEALRQVRILAALEDDTAKDFLKRLFTGKDNRIHRINDQDSDY